MNLRRLHSDSQCIIDQYDKLAWVTLFSKNELSEKIKHDLEKKGITGAVKIYKTKTDAPDQPQIWFGDVEDFFQVIELGIAYEIHTTSSHPGLFLDHQITRKWLKENTKDKSVLNLFSYTGSLGISAAMGGAGETINIDLSNQTTQWAKKNAMLNNLGGTHQFIKGDVFDWMNRFNRRKTMFDIVISDPPSQSRSDEMHFSTEKHLDMLHELCITCINPQGILITSINTETISEKVLIASVNNISKKQGRKIKKIETLPLPKGFDPDFRSMKGCRIFFSN